MLRKIATCVAVLMPLAAAPALADDAKMKVTAFPVEHAGGGGK